LAKHRDLRKGEDLEKKILVVSHGMTMKALFSSGLEPDKPAGKGF
jgi:broad specificity phosphatase PhoE